MSNNVLIIHGGGLVDPSKEVIFRVAKEIWNMDVYQKIYIGKYSFMSLYDHTLWLEYYSYLEEAFETKRGTFFGTCRGIDLTSPDLMERTWFNLKNRHIKTVIVCGGDGSSRQCAEIHENFKRHGINIVFAVPLTVDGINGGYSIGLEQATRECIRQIENVTATSLETRDNGEFSVVAVELQGRNRDDILASVLQQIYRNGKVADCNLNDIVLKVVPANYETDEENLLSQINSVNMRTLILVSEGADFKVSELQKKTHRKVRTVVVGHAVQSNGLTTAEDMQKYSDWLIDVGKIISDNPYESYCIVNDGISRWREPIDYYAKLNPREGQQAKLSKGLEELIKDYMV